LGVGLIWDICAIYGQGARECGVKIPLGGFVHTTKLGMT
jgi:hypothetical protein